MADILHRVGIESPAAEVYTALTTTGGLTGWWTADTQGEGDGLGGVLRFRFEAGGFDMKVVELRPAEHVRWEVVDGPEEWIGTHVDWNLGRAGDRTIVLFKHEGWREPVPFMHHCSTKWATYLMSLKSLVETGKGAPHPHDVKIDDWD
ncbi:SRPBCC domain-containing protein [Planomonospora sp. ID91781]|uniref:Activator of HSP90 ATPase n=1 Tax=Planomonospora sphaerica TaxID=161355 RepID=A0A171D5L3_9ACTN|nr:MULTISPECIES: SRPBCC domain-containing protein [Planomonospora]MBG0825479.1 SRPBCC domain-containing protein [Planomonospora sp. ID91781]GAT67677.1 activator of HSP90 ATPase [Planomonospora sphaerica]